MRDILNKIPKFPYFAEIFLLHFSKTNIFFNNMLKQLGKKNCQENSGANYLDFGSTHTSSLYNFSLQGSYSGIWYS